MAGPGWDPGFLSSIANLGGGMDPSLGLVSGGIKMLGNMFANEYAENAADRQQAFNQANMFQQTAMSDVLARKADAFSAQQADIARSFSAAEAEKAFERSQASNREAMAFAASQSDLNRQFQERMSSSAYQRATADMRAAGINPMVAYMQGGASTPGGGQAVGSAASSPAASSPSPSGAAGAAGLAGAGMRHVFNPMEGVLTTAMEAARLRPQIEAIRQGTALGAAQENTQNAQAAQYRASSALTHQQVRTEIENTRRVAAEARNAEEEKSKVSFGGGSFYPEHWFPGLTETTRSLGAGDKDPIGLAASAARQSMVRTVQENIASAQAGVRMHRRGSGDSVYYSSMPNY